MFGNSKETEFSPNWLLPFYNLVKVTGLKTKEASTGSIQFSLELEGIKSTTTNFKGQDKLNGNKAEGNLGIVPIGIYTNADKNQMVRGLVESFAKMGIKTGTIDAMQEVFKSSFVPSEDGLEYELVTKTNEFMISVFEQLTDILIESKKFIWVAITARTYQGKLYNNGLKAIKSKLQSGESIFSIFVQKQEDMLKADIDEDGYILNFVYNSEGKPKKAEKVDLKSQYWVKDNETEATTFDAINIDTASIDDLPF